MEAGVELPLRNMLTDSVMSPANGADVVLAMVSENVQLPPAVHVPGPDLVTVTSEPESQQA